MHRPQGNHHHERVSASRDVAGCITRQYAYLLGTIQSAIDCNARLYVALVSYILQTCPALAAVLLSALGTRIHASAVRVLFTSMILPDDARYFLAFDVSHRVPSHPVCAVLLNPERYARAIKRIIVTDAGLPPPFEALEVEGSSGLLIIDEEDSDTQATSKHTRVAVQPMLAKSLNQLLTVCANLEQFIWNSANPPPDGVCEVCS